ncbi:hypothetical protein ALO36_103955 [Pseudomonas syringae pv. tomato]|uniref:Uncharacterized protein n=1 Tax=Pseudomonas syringae pv. maculicola TaxID=59511 RepID=A0A0P9Y2N5_PSEYM|nr:hypothetical protein ALO84_102279 [Pseudomonas syringae pv. maculicola]KPY95712.1 hypothetical protein ALO36_103955 [Pseudomonas syringae pv. tomato]RMV31978.1 hypothetical protein ALP13_103763 [Pseudomonas syringae pv. maculicola]
MKRDSYLILGIAGKLGETTLQGLYNRRYIILVLIPKMMIDRSVEASCVEVNGEKLIITKTRSLWV